MRTMERTTNFLELIEDVAWTSNVGLWIPGMEWPVKVDSFHWDFPILGSHDPYAGVVVSLDHSISCDMESEMFLPHKISRYRNGVGQVARARPTGTILKLQPPVTLPRVIKGERLCKLSFILIIDKVNFSRRPLRRRRPQAQRTLLVGASLLTDTN